MYETLASDEQIKITSEALKANGIDVKVVNSGEEAKNLVLEMIPKGVSVMPMTSITLETIGLNSGEYKSGRDVLYGKDSTAMEKKIAGNLAEWAIGSVHGVTENGEVLIVSNTGSQLPSYAYSSDHVVWVVGAQKLAKNLDESMKRLREYIMPLESKRAQKAYGLPENYQTNASKILILSRELKPGRITMVIVKEKLGF
jgi:hypothetical protein